jgi:inosine/xanthosine triphosphatase
MTDEETILGANNRAKAALLARPEARFGVGLEGGIQKTAGRYFESCWVVVCDASGKLGIGCSAKFELSSHFMEPILAGEELATVIDRLSGQDDVRSSQGAMGIVTNGVLCRTESMEHGVVFAFSPFVSDARYWDN